MQYGTASKRSDGLMSASDKEKLDRYPDNGYYELDTTLAVEGKAADAKAVGDAIKKSKELPVTKNGIVADFECEENDTINVLNTDTDGTYTLYHQGKNFAPTPGSGTKNGISYNTNADGSITISGTATANTYIKIPHYIPAGDYCMTCECEGLSTDFYYSLTGNHSLGYDLFYGFLMNADGKIKKGTVNVGYDADIYIYVASGITVNTTGKFQMELGSAATDFEPFNCEEIEAEGIVSVNTYAGTNIFFSRDDNNLIASTGSIESEEKQWNDKKWVCVGDSLTETNARTDKHYHDYIAEATDITVVNMGISGSGYAAKADKGLAFYQRISSVPADADVVTIFGSFNDMSAGLELGTPTDTGVETLCGCINTTIDNIITVMPAVSLGIVSPAPWHSHYPSNTEEAGTKYCDALRSICEYRSIPFLDLYRCSNLRPWTEEGRSACYTKDDGSGVHPDETGHKLIAPRFKAFLETLII